MSHAQTEKSLPCPACDRVAMKKFSDSAIGLVIDACPKCWGIWFDAGEMRDFLRSEGLKRQFLKEGRLKNAKTHGSGGDRRCPRCAEAMERPTVADITVDLCRHCLGVWLDHGEIDTLVQNGKRKRLKGDQLIVDQIREGLQTGNMPESVWERLLSAIRDLLAKLFPDEP